MGTSREIEKKEKEERGRNFQREVEKKKKKKITTKNVLP